MDKQDIEKRAKELEAIGPTGDTSGLAAQLHEMPPDERLAIAKQMKSDTGIISDLPSINLRFADSGDLSSSDVRKPDGSVNHMEFDPSTGRPNVNDSATEEFNQRMQRDAGPSGDTIRVDNNAATNTSTIETSGNDGTADISRFDAKTNHLKSVDYYGANSGGLHEEFDEGGKELKTLDTRYTDGSTDHRTFDSAGKPNSEHKTDRDGSVCDINFDGGKPVSEDVATVDGIKYHVEMDPETGKMKTVDKTDAQGVTTHYDIPPEKNP